MAIQSRPLTFEDLQRMRETRDERLELIDGELFVTPSPTRLHQLVAKRLTRLLLHAIDDAGVGAAYFAPFDVKLADDSVVQPDLLSVTNARRDRLASAGVEGARISRSRSCHRRLAAPIAQSSAICMRDMALQSIGSSIRMPALSPSTVIRLKATSAMSV